MSNKYGQSLSATFLKFAVAMVSLAGLAFGQGVQDQVNDPPFTGGAVNIAPNNRVSQTFVPSLPCLIAIDAGLKTGNTGRGGDQVTLKVFDSSGTILASASASIPEGFDGYWHFSLAGSGVTVTPSQPITIQLEDTNKIVFFWKYAKGNPYAAGKAFFHNSTFSTNDFFFKSYGTANGCGATINKQVIYQIITDRFFDGDPANNNPPQSPDLYDATHQNLRLYWGGDFAGIPQKIPYLLGMGVTTIWISPPLDNINVVYHEVDNIPGAGYHGYWTRDFKRPEEHFGSASNSWTEFDNLVAAAHKNGIKVIVDFVPNHSNPSDAGEKGSLYDNGTFLAACDNDNKKFFHHNPGIGDFSDRYQVQYDTLSNLCDLDQENPTVDAYLKSALQQFAQHGVDGFRIDAVKHVTWGWQYSMVNAIWNNAPSFVFGEWMQESTGDALYHDSYKFANRSGMSLLDFPLYAAIRNVFASDNPFSAIDSTLNTENANFVWQNMQVTFVDNHDKRRLLTVKNDNNRLHEAIAFLLTARGIPVIYYGDEQYLHDDNNQGDDPNNRPMMTSFGNTTAYTVIGKLAKLRRDNNALAYGTSRQRWINNDVYIYERQFFNSVVLVAINKSDSSDQPISGLLTALPPGNYSDYLNGTLSGVGMTVGSGNPNENPVQNFSLPAHSVSVWQFVGSVPAPEVGAINSTVGQPGMAVTVTGQGFGGAMGSVWFDATPATIESWSDSAVSFVVPHIGNGGYNVQLKNNAGVLSNPIHFTALAGKLIPVTFTVDNATSTNMGDYIFLTGNTVELGNWGATFDTAVGPMLAPHYPDWFLNVALPAGRTVEFKFIKIAGNGTVTWEAGANHKYTVPNSGTGFVNVDWQY